MIFTIVLWTIATYLIASIPFSLIIGRVLLGKDIREFGDGNPGATNLLRAGGNRGHYLLGLLADGFKGLFPVGIPYWLMGWSDWEVMPIAFAAIIGHAFSIYLKFDGGKAIAVTAGIWVGLIVFEALLVIPIAIVYWHKAVNEDHWVIALTMLSLLAYLLYTRPGNSALLMIWMGNMLLILYTHRKEGQLKKLPSMRLPKPKNVEEDASQTR